MSSSNVDCKPLTGNAISQTLREQGQKRSHGLGNRSEHMLEGYHGLVHAVFMTI